MRIGRSWFVVGMLVAAVACKGKGDSASASGSATATAVGSGAGPTASGSGTGPTASGSGSGSASGSDSASGSGSATGSGAAPAGADDTRKLTPAEQVVTDWLLAVLGGNDKRAAELTTLPFTAGGFQLSGCKPATNAAELTAFVKCASADDLMKNDVSAQTLADQNSVAEEKDSGEHAAFHKEYAKDVKRLPAGHTRVHVGINGDGQYLEFLLTVKDGKVTGGVFGGEAAE